MSLDLTLIAQMVIFITMVILMSKLLYQPLNDAMESRTTKIADGLAAAEAGQNAQAEAEAEVKVQLDAAKQRAVEIVAAAERRALEVAEEATNKARQESALIVQNAQDEAAGEEQRLRQALQQEVASLAMLAAERIVESELDASKHNALIQKVIDQGVAA
ncbi:MAG: F0F1 ATP synthase subunit B [Mariprofundaceae bacterium]|nr:F0F1 ATP synthase subunit B [Mariprofundaceae bacterium]